MYFILCKDTRGEWRWTFRSANDEAICVSSQGYTSQPGALHGIALVKQGATAAENSDDSTKTSS